MAGSSALRHIPELDGVRGIAILMVLLFHFGGPPINLGLWGIGYGWAGVDLFFVLSGYLITTILLNTTDSPHYFSSFYARRVLRIFPLYFLALALYFFVEVRWLNSRGINSSLPIGDQLWCWFYLLNWHDVKFGIISNLSHLWSLSIEEQFYVVWPLAIWLCKKKQVPLLCITTVASSFLLRLLFEITHANPEFLHRATITRLDTLALGGLLACVLQNESWSHWVRQRERTIAGFAIVALLAVLAGGFDRFLPYTLNYITLALVFGVLIFHCCSRTGDATPVCIVTRWKSLRSIGKFSYSIYLFHAVVHRYVPVLIARFLIKTDLLWLPLTAFRVIVVIVSIGVSYLIGLTTWYVFEKHILRLKDHFEYGDSWKKTAPVPEDTVPELVKT